MRRAMQKMPQTSDGPEESEQPQMVPTTSWVTRTYASNAYYKSSTKKINKSRIDSKVYNR